MVALPLMVVGPASAVEYMSADVLVQDITASMAADSFTCAATVLTNGGGDDSARAVTLVVVLPLEVKVVDLSPACTPVDIAGGTHLDKPRDLQMGFARPSSPAKREDHYHQITTSEEQELRWPDLELGA